MRYRLFLDKLVNMLTPIPLRGRDNVLWIQSCLFPLSKINEDFHSYTKEKLIQANVTSQVLHFEWYLNHKFLNYFQNQGDTIKLVHYVDLGVSFYFKDEVGEVPNLVWAESDDWSTASTEEQPKPLYFADESLTAIGASFRVDIPDITISNEEFDILLKSEIERYRILGKTYNIQHTV